MNHPPGASCIERTFINNERVGGEGLVCHPGSETSIDAMRVEPKLTPLGLNLRLCR